MPFRTILFVMLSLAVTGCSSVPATRFTVPFLSPEAPGRYVSTPVQCVPYARDASGIQIYGDAHTWWDKAAPNYQRSNRPQPGSVLVLSRTNRMRHGHVAVVKRVVTPREIDVTHSNWGDDWKSRRVIYDSARVADISPRNDWTQVRFWNYEKNCFGFPYAARGFIHK